MDARKPLKSVAQPLNNGSRWIARGLAVGLLSTKGEGVFMSKYVLSAVLLIGLVQLTHAEEAQAPATEAPAVATSSEDSRDPASEKSFFETRTFEEMQQELKAVMNDDASSAHGG